MTQQTKETPPIDRAGAVARVLADIENGAEALTLTEATRLPECRRGGRSIHLATLYRRMNDGTLDTALVGARRVTTRPSIARMIARQSGATEPVRLITPRQRQKQVDDAERRLQAAGI